MSAVILAGPSSRSVISYGRGTCGKRYTHALLAQERRADWINAFTRLAEVWAELLAVLVLPTASDDRAREGELVLRQGVGDREGRHGGDEQHGELHLERIERSMR